MGIVQGTPRVMADLEAIVRRFVAHTGWQPQRVEFVAGAIPYSRYGLIKRWVMQYMSRQAGVKTSPSQDYEYTDWEALRRFAVTFAEAIPAAR
jgi:menaquinone-dependent protoporphyrinogen oxidase